MASAVRVRARPSFFSGILDGTAVERLRRTFRAGFIAAVKKTDTATCLVMTAGIHGHYCLGSALGVMASLYSRDILKNNETADGMIENLLAIVEVNACFVDGVQAVSGCTLVNDGLIYRDLGKRAVPFAVRGREEGIRIRALPEFRLYIEDVVPEFYPLMDKVIMKRAGTPDDLRRFREKGRESAFALSGLPFTPLFETRTVVPDTLPHAPIAGTVICPVCREPVMASRIRKHGSRRGTRRMCSGGYLEVNGQGIVKKNSTGKMVGTNGRRCRNE